MRLALIVAVVVVLVAAIVGWAVRDGSDAGPVSDVYESHGLPADQAACFGYGRIEQRAAATLSDDFDASERQVVAALSAEVERLDALAGSYPEADYRLIDAFDAVAASSQAYLDDDDPRADALILRETAAGAAAATCEDVAGFDVVAQQPID